MHSRHESEIGPSNLSLAESLDIPGGLMSELNIFAGHFRFRLPFALALLLLAAAPFHSAHSAEGSQCGRRDASGRRARFRVNALLPPPPSNCHKNQGQMTAPGSGEITIDERMGELEIRVSLAVITSIVSRRTAPSAPKSYRPGASARRSGA